MVKAVLKMPYNRNTLPFYELEKEGISKDELLIPHEEVSNFDSCRPIETS